METTGIIRRIDEFGRIVIPKEIRKYLNIKDGEELEISAQHDIIALRKYYRIYGMKDKLNGIVDIFYKHLGGTLFLTDREKIIVSHGENLTNQKLNKKYINILNERKRVSNLDNNLIEITNEYKKNVNYIFNPIIVNTDLLGSIIYLNDNINENEIQIFNIMCSLIKNELDN